MKARWQKLAARVEGLTQRERVLVFVGVLAVLACAGEFGVLGPLHQRQLKLKNEIAQQRASLLETETAIAQRIEASQRDPDLPQRDRLSQVRADSARIDQQLREMQSGLVAPERVAPLLESMLRANGRLKLVAMQTLPVSSLDDLAGAAPEPAAKAAPATEEAKLAAKLAPAPDPKSAAKLAGVPDKPGLLFRHGVELTVRGSYLDMIDYMSALEALPAQLFWGKAQLQVEDYPSVRLTLTLYTLSLDPKWMKL